MRQSISLVLIVGGLSILGYCSFVRADTWIFQHREGQAISRLDESASTPGPRALGPSGLIGRIAIARLGLSAVITEGAGKDVLRRAVGHVPGTAFPGKPGNVGLAGHRDTFLRPLRNVRLNDIIVLIDGARRIPLPRRFHEGSRSAFGRSP